MTFRLIGQRERKVEDPVVYSWVDLLTYHHTEEVDYWQVKIDEIWVVT